MVAAELEPFCCEQNCIGSCESGMLFILFNVTTL
jgi:hypothetical protein